MIMATNEKTCYWYEIAYGCKTDLSEIILSAFHQHMLLKLSETTDFRLASRAGYLLNDLERKTYLANDNKISYSTAFPGDRDPRSDLE